MILSACAGQEATRSNSLYDCRDWPATEIGKKRSEKERAEYITKGYSAWASCKDALKIIKSDTKV